MEENKKKQLENESHSRVNEPLEGAVAYSSGVAHAEEPLYDFNGKDFGLPTTLEEVKAELKEADRELKTPEAWTTLSSFLTDFKQSHSSWLK
jgi:hypothetical protein